ncbi:hypothetical protein DFH08DRAFT_915940 [Mycena albidolilacea]|uniref:Reverse transcriptase zinc-binding domain-containing protein n=1 Tax=Mycena albidolilacea TaxID=1033008 RepID=A0AAD6ZSM0_9AGAR|nr:hypothetical protein DFH08DRAFT_915940 [Mycena albidolilacea]
MSQNIHRLTQNFLWKSTHNIYHVGSFWNHIRTLEIFGPCSTCQALESLEHIMLECNAPEILWKFRYPTWPKLNWGLLLGCGLARFKSPPRLFETHIAASEAEIHNRWVAIMNTALKRDKLLTNRVRFGSLGIKKQLVLDTWSGALLDEDSLPDDWTRSEGVLVGIRPITRSNGVG